jgi:hypothetical protein
MAMWMRKIAKKSRQFAQSEAIRVSHAPSCRGRVGSYNGSPIHHGHCSKNPADIRHAA